MSRIIDASWHPLVDGLAPAWASGWGQDRYGVYVAFTIGGVTQRMRWIPPSRFRMGSNDEAGRWKDEGPLHDVTIADGFWLFETACTEALWEAVTDTAPEPRRGPAFPVTNISWDDAQDFIRLINAAKVGLDLTLPSEACWEYACRAGTTTPYHFGSEISGELACYEADSPVAVGSLPPNRWGLREMHGNVDEWCADQWHENYAGAPTDGSSWIDVNEGAALRVLRGGSWNDVARRVRAAYRNLFVPSVRGDYVGFRCARVQM